LDLTDFFSSPLVGWMLLKERLFPEMLFVEMFLLLIVDPAPAVFPEAVRPDNQESS
jgi:hypothetical protein